MASAKKRSKAQIAAFKKFAAGGRAAQAHKRAAYKASHHGKNPPRTARQIAGARKAGHTRSAAAAARRAGKQPVKPRPRAAPLTRDVSPGIGDIHSLPVCAAVAVADHLELVTGWRWTDEEILELAVAAGGADGGVLIPSVLEVAAAGWRDAPSLRYFPAQAGPGTIAGLTLPDGRPHAALVLPGNLVSWGNLIPNTGITEETWAIQWLL